MDCSKMQELLSAYANDQLALTQREFAEEYLSVCASCQRVLTTGVAYPTQITVNNKDHSRHSRIYHVTVRRSENIQRANA